MKLAIMIRTSNDSYVEDDPPSVHVTDLDAAVRRIMHEEGYAPDVDDVRSDLVDEGCFHGNKSYFINGPGMEDFVDGD